MELQRSLPSTLAPLSPTHPCRWWGSDYKWLVQLCIVFNIGQCPCACSIYSHWYYLLLAHLSRRLIWWAYRIGRPLSSVVRCRRRRPHSLNISSETTGPIKVKFHMELLWDGGTKICSNGLGHMTKMAAMPIYDKNLKKSSSLEPKGWWPWNLVCIIGCSSTTKIAQMMTLVDLDQFYDKVKFGSLCFCMGKR